MRLAPSCRRGRSLASGAHRSAHRRRQNGPHRHHHPRRWVGWATTATLALHAGLYSYLWWGEKRFLDRVAVPTNLAGLLAALAGAALAATSTAWFRRCCYLAFRTTHVLAAPAYLALSVVHDRKMAYFITPAVALYAADAALRWWQWGAGGSGVALGGGDVDVVVVGGGGEGAGDQAQMVTLRLGPWQVSQALLCACPCGRLLRPQQMERRVLRGG